jgi:ADP-ribosylglycohydrolase
MAINRAQGCWLGQLTGDALGSLVEFQSPGEIRRLYPAGGTLSGGWGHLGNHRRSTHR